MLRLIGLSFGVQALSDFFSLFSHGVRRAFGCRWLLFFFLIRGERCHVSAKLGPGWVYEYKVKWEMLPVIISRAIHEQLARNGQSCRLVEVRALFSCGGPAVNNAFFVFSRLTSHVSRLTSHVSCLMCLIGGAERERERQRQRDREKREKKERNRGVGHACEWHMTDTPST